MKIIQHMKPESGKIRYEIHLATAATPEMIDQAFICYATITLPDIHGNCTYKPHLLFPFSEHEPNKSYLKLLAKWSIDNHLNLIPGAKKVISNEQIPLFDKTEVTLDDIERQKRQIATPSTSIIT